MLYQEDILRVAQEVAGFSLAQGDELRKAISKNRSRQAVAAFQEQFVEGAVDRGVERDTATEIWEQIKAFAAYSYCKAHACTYGHISYQATYLKAHWPAEFIASVIANKAGFYDPRTYFEEARRFNVQILPPCVNASQVETQPEPGPEPAIRPGLEFVRSLTAATTQRILQHRAARPFSSLLDLHLRVHPNATEMENLVLSGALDSLGRTRPTLLMQMERLPDKPPPQGHLFEASPQYGAAPSAGPRVPDQPGYPLSRRVLVEMQTLGFSHSGHTLDGWSSALEQCPPLTTSYQVPRRVGRRVHYAGWLVTTRRALTRESRYMRFLTLEDRHGVAEVVLFPDVYRRCGKQITGAGVYLVRGRIKEQNGATSIVAEQVEALPSGG
jgi:DNA polymerase III alpha subunit